MPEMAQMNCTAQSFLHIMLGIPCKHSRQVTRFDLQEIEPALLLQACQHRLGSMHQISIVGRMTLTCSINKLSCFQIFKRIFTHGLKQKKALSTIGLCLKFEQALVGK